MVTSEPQRDSTYPGMHDMLGGNADGPSNLMIYPYGTGNDDTTGTIYIYAVEKLGSSWFWTELVALSVTLCTDTGVASGDMTASERFADTITAAAGPVADVDYHIVQPGTNKKAYVVIDLKGAMKFEIVTKVGTATNLNALVKMLP